MAGAFTSNKSARGLLVAKYREGTLTLGVEFTHLEITPATMPSVDEMASLSFLEEYGHFTARGKTRPPGKLSQAERLALAVLQGDREAALALADFVQQEWLHESLGP